MVAVVSEAEEVSYDAMLATASEAEDIAEPGYFSEQPTARSLELDGMIGDVSLKMPQMTAQSEPVTPTVQMPLSPVIPPRRSPSHVDPDLFAEAVFFAYGVVVFFGFDEAQERGILEDVETAEIMQKPLPEERWEIEECHYEVRCLRKDQRETIFKAAVV